MTEGLYAHILHQNIDTSKSVDLGYPQGAPLRINCVGVPLVSTRGYW
jgi:hypothetical protein